MAYRNFESIPALLAGLQADLVCQLDNNNIIVAWRDTGNYNGPYDKYRVGPWYLHRRYGWAQGQGSMAVDWPQRHLLMAGFSRITEAEIARIKAAQANATAANKLASMGAV